jgi:hypothetical protein
MSKFRLRDYGPQEKKPLETVSPGPCQPVLHRAEAAVLMRAGWQVARSLSGGWGKLRIRPHPALVEGGRYRIAKTVKTVDVRSFGT